MTDDQTTNEVPRAVIAAVIESFKAHRSTLLELERIAKEAADAARDAYDVLERETIKVEELARWLEDQTQGRHPFAVPHMVEQRRAERLKGHEITAQQPPIFVKSKAVTRMDLILEYLSALDDDCYMRLHSVGGVRIMRWVNKKPHEQIEYFDTVDLLIERIIQQRHPVPVVIVSDEIERIIAYLRRNSGAPPLSFNVYGIGNGYVEASGDRPDRGAWIFNRVERFLEDIEQEEEITDD